ncbi:hypothetical protein HY498_01060 [Candidatus Woesearchaeota archaeon]|nr:hypothetical protein [Candidatus Woesearchaeota archaeon]
MYEYLWWVITLGILWIIVYIFTPLLRRKIIWSSLIAFPFGFGELYFIPNYWKPETLFNLGLRYGIDVEAFGLMFFLGGIAAFIYEGLLKKRIAFQKLCRPICKCYTPLIITLSTFVILIRAFPFWNIIYPSSFACLVGGLWAFFVYPRLRSHILLGGLLFGIFYWLSLFIIEIFSPGWIVNTWNLSALSGIMLLKIPVEEVLFGFSFGVIWTPLFEEVCSNLYKK